MRHKALAIYDYLLQNVAEDKPKMLQNIPIEDNQYDVVFSKVVNPLGFYFKVEIFLFGTPVQEFSINDVGGMVAEITTPGNRLNPEEKYLDAILSTLDLYGPFLNNPITVREIAPIPPHKWPYNYDHSRMGASISKEWEVMHHSLEEGKITDMVLIHLPTGRRFDLDLFQAEKPLTTVMTENDPVLQNSNGTLLEDKYNVVNTET